MTDEVKPDSFRPLTEEEIQARLIKQQPLMKNVPNPQTKADTDLGCGLGEWAETGPDDPFYKECVGHDWRSDDRQFGTNPTGENIEQSNDGFFEAMDAREKEIEFQYEGRLNLALRLRKYVYEGAVNLFTWLGLVK